VGTSRATSPTDGPADFGEAVDALYAIPASSSYPKWRDVSFAFADAARDDAQAYQVWDRWCRTCAQKYDGAKQPEYWRSFSKPGAITKATLFHIAMEHGWDAREYLDRIEAEFIQGQIEAHAYSSTEEGRAEIISFLDVIMGEAARGGKDEAMVDDAAAAKPNGSTKFETEELRRQHEEELRRHGNGPKSRREAPKNEKFFKDDEPRQRKREAPPPLFKSAADLQHKRFADLKYIVPGLVVEGLTLFAGRPKIGKSWLVVDVAIAVATGGTCLGVKCEKGDVLLLTLEDNDRRLQRRLTKLLGANKADWPGNLRYTTIPKQRHSGGMPGRGVEQQPRHPPRRGGYMEEIPHRKEHQTGGLRPGLRCVRQSTMRGIEASCEHHRCAPHAQGQGRRGHRRDQRYQRSGWRGRRLDGHQGR
jgi:AAA domain/Primase C terminal 2 (PriCT-2)